MKLLRNTYININMVDISRKTFKRNAVETIVDNDGIF